MAPQASEGLGLLLGTTWVGGISYRAHVDLRIEPVLWTITYPVNPHDPIGWIRRRRDGFHAKLESELLGVYSDGDAAAVAVWERFLERALVEHDIASRLHGSDERSGHRGLPKFNYRCNL